MKPSDFQKTIQCQFDCKLKRVVKNIVRNKRATHAVIREQPLEKLLCHDLYSQNNDTSAWCGSAHKNGNS